MAALLNQIKNKEKEDNIQHLHNGFRTEVKEEIQENIRDKFPPRIRKLNDDTLIATGKEFKGSKV